MDLKVTEARNDCTGEDQQQFSRPYPVRKGLSRTRTHILAVKVSLRRLFGWSATHYTPCTNHLTQILPLEPLSCEWRHISPHASIVKCMRLKRKLSSVALVCKFLIV
jgi:hypothetical protein